MAEGTQGFAAFSQAIQMLQQATSGGGGGGLTPAQQFSNLPDDQRWANSGRLPAADPGYAWAEDLTQVPTNYWDNRQTPAQQFSALPDEQRFQLEDYLPNPDPGYAWAEDLTQVPTNYWD